MPKPLYIFDLDGTLALIEHRRHFVEGANRNWPAFYAACVDDVPNWPVIETLSALQMGGAEVRVWSGRSDEVRAETEKWLKDYFIPTKNLQMRPAGDHQPDDKLKASWLDALAPADRKRLVATFDDRDRMVAMWRSWGLTCFQVAPGNF